MANNNDAVIKRQIELPWSKAFQMSMNSIRTRFWRTMITAAGVFLGIAFLQSVLTSSAILEHSGVALDQSDHMRSNWLVVMSLLVSTVGVVNSMLMSVAERYREIGTMKCLGALDRLVVKIFLIEAFLTGLLASICGAIIGFLGMLVMQWIQLGGRFGMAFSAAGGQILRSMLMSIAIGTLLSLIAAWYPAWRASKLPPAAALRHEL